MCSLEPPQEPYLRPARPYPPPGKRSPGHDLYGLPWPQFTLEYPAGRKVPLDIQDRRVIPARPLNILPTDGVPVHGRIVPGRILRRGITSSPRTRPKHCSRVSRSFPRAGMFSTICSIASATGIMILRHPSRMGAEEQGRPGQRHYGKGRSGRRDFAY